MMLILVIASLSTVVPPAHGNAAAIAAVGGQLLGGGQSHTIWEVRGQVFDSSKCWTDGGGPCPNGDCLDNNGRRGVLIKETIVGCKFFCVNRGVCKQQLCCDRAARPTPIARPPAPSSGGLPSRPCSQWGWRFYDHYDIVGGGNDLPAHTQRRTGDRNQCQPHCRATAGCRSYTWRMGVCYLKKGAANGRACSDCYSAIIC